MKDFFDRVYLVNLARRPDRLERFNEHMATVDWPFGPITVFPAVDGSVCPPPEIWQSGAGAWGCRESHRAILAEALVEKLSRILILEDDAYVCRPASFADDVTRVLDAVEKLGWDCLMLGGQHVNRNGTGDPTPAGEGGAGILRCRDCERTHAYALSGAKVMAGLYKLWSGSITHIDWNAGPYLGRSFRTYAPDPFLFGQTDGKSDINGRENRRQTWSRSGHAPVIWLRGPRAVLEEMRAGGTKARRHEEGNAGGDARAPGLHAGYTRNQDGTDVGLSELIASSMPFSMKVTQLRELVSLLQAEADAIGPEAVVCLWHPKLKGELVAAAVPGCKCVESSCSAEALAGIAEVVGGSSQ